MKGSNLFLGESFGGVERGLSMYRALGRVCFCARGRAHSRAVVGTYFWAVLLRSGVGLFLRPGRAHS
jgi:hypothetical protein